MVAAVQLRWFAIGLMAMVFLADGRSTFAAAAPAESPQPSGRVFKALGAALAAGFKDAKEDEKTAAGEVATAPAAEPPVGWVDVPPSQKWAITEQGRTGDVYQMHVAIGSCESRAECDARLPEAIEAGLLAYAEQSRPAAAGNVRFPAEGFERRVVCKDSRELAYHSENAGTRTQLHVVLEFDRDLLGDIKDQWNLAIVAQRLWYTGTGLAALLGLLAVVYCGLVIDRATGGKRRGRLGFAAVAAGTLIAVVAAAVIDAVS